jgi:hypothetical protein
MFDVLYWTFATTFMASVFGDKAWWMWLAIPVYSIYAAYSTFMGVRQGMGLGVPAADPDTGNGVTSNRQKKMEKRGGQKVQYRQ